MIFTKILSILLCVIMTLASFFSGGFKKSEEPDEPSPTEPAASQSGDPSDDKSWGDIQWN